MAGEVEGEVWAKTATGESATAAHKAASTRIFLLGLIIYKRAPLPDQPSGSTLVLRFSPNVTAGILFELFGVVIDQLWINRAR